MHSFLEAWSGQTLCYKHTLGMGVDDVSNQELDLYPHYIAMHLLLTSNYSPWARRGHHAPHKGSLGVV